MTDRNYIEHLFKAHYAQMYRLATVLLHDDDLARDMVHDVFVSLLDGNTGSILTTGSYLLKSVRNRCLNYIRDCEIHQRISNRYFIDDLEFDAEDWPDDATIDLIHDLIDNDISAQAKLVIQLRFSCAMPFARIATTMGISETAVYRHLSHALKIIRNKLNGNGYI